MDYSRIFNQSTGNKSLNPMPPPPIPDPPPLPTGQVSHEPQTTDSPLKILSEITKFLNEALSPKNPARILNENQIQALLDQTIKLKSAMNIESHLEKITERLERLERRPLTVSPPTPSTWPSVTTTNNKKTNPTINKQGKSTSMIPSNAQINEFKKSSLVIRTPPGFVALDSATATEITTKINKYFYKTNYIEAHITNDQSHNASTVGNSATLLNGVKILHFVTNAMAITHLQLVIYQHLLPLLAVSAFLMTNLYQRKQSIH
ncbi:hypothetical protein PGT21_009405 [Puccinia graminis f. sp. tritici]|uniref:Uncharacterized protein n=1 Tax=Puccinia graminis f. sp. tritici TaxID=56615 RepID=A0A5B0PU35_PUCGR|nr:hypothetical protein PGT21_009405 [Puccinia graminis f. sp. tritici]